MAFSVYGEAQAKISILEIRSLWGSNELGGSIATTTFLYVQQYKEQRCQRACKTIGNCLVKKEKEALPYFFT